MTRSSFYITRFLQFFGIFNRNKYLNAASSESQLLTLAKRFLGASAWPHVKNIEEMSMPYWTLHNLYDEYEELSKLVEVSKDSLQETNLSKQIVVKEWTAELRKLEEERKELIQTLENQRIKIVSNREDARKKRFEIEGAKAQIKVIEKGNPINQSELEDVNESLNQKLKEFEVLKENDTKYNAELRQMDQQLNEVQQKITDQRQTLKERASKAYSTIGLANQQNSEIMSKLRHLEQQITKLQTQVGSYIIANYENDKRLKQVVKCDRLLFARSKCLRDSIVYLYRLTDI